MGGVDLDVKNQATYWLPDALPGSACPPRPIIFTGSSIIALWEGLPAFVGSRPVLNTAISGSQTADLIPRLYELALRFSPQMLCYYCGSNDINNALPPQVILANTYQTFAILRAHFPDLRLIYLSIIKAPQKQDRWNWVEQVNSALCQYAEQTGGLDYIDINPLFFTPQGSPRAEFYLEDQLHLTTSAYAALNAFLFPILAERST
jgi:lysophospholipase L1-like esterase